LLDPANELVMKTSTGIRSETSAVIRYINFKYLLSFIETSFKPRKEEPAKKNYFYNK
jgi:hypothetical protein